MQEKNINKTAVIKMTVTLLLPLIICLIPTNEMFTNQIRLFLAVTLAAILGYAFEQFNQTLVSILLPIAYTLFKVSDASVAFSSWSNSVVWMTLGGLMLADMAGKSGFLQRLALKCIILTGGTYSGIIWGLAISGLLLGILLAGQGYIPMAALAFGICTALGIKQTKEAAGIMLAAVFSGILTGTFIFNTGPIMYASFAGMQMNISWVEYFLKQPVGLIYFVAMFFILEKLCRPKEGLNGKAYFQQEYEKLGKIKPEEIKALTICLLLLIFLLTTKIHGISVMWGFALFPLIAYLPGIGFCDANDMKNTNFGMAFFIAACMAIGTVGTSLGIGQLVSALAMPIIEGKSVSIVFFVIYLLCILLNFIMTPLAIAAAFSLPFAQIMINLGVNPDAFFLFETIALDQIFLPYEYVVYLIVFSFGAIRIQDFIKLMSIKAVVATIYIFFILLPFWRLIGFLMV